MKTKTEETYTKIIADYDEKILQLESKIEELIANDKARIKEIEQLRTEKAFIKKSADSVSGLLEESEFKRCLLADIAKGIISQIEAQ